MLILSLGFWRRADSTCFVSRSATIIFHSPEIKHDITDFSNVSCYSIYKYFGDNHDTFSETVHLLKLFQPSYFLAFIMQHTPLVNQFFSDLAGFSGFFSRSPKRTSVLDRVVAHRLPRASTVRWNFHLCAVNTVFEHECDIIQCFETIRGVLAYHSAESSRICVSTGRWYFQLLPETISLHYALCGHFLQPAQEADHQLSLCLGNHAAVHTLFLTSAYII